MNARLFVDAIEREAAKPEYPPAIREHVAELVDLIARRHDAAELLEAANTERLGLRATVALFRRPRLVT